MVELLAALSDSRGIVRKLGPDASSISNQRVSVWSEHEHLLRGAGLEAAQLAALVYCIEGLAIRGGLSDLSDWKLEITGVPARDPETVASNLAAVLEFCLQTTPQIQLTPAPDPELEVNAEVRHNPASVLLFSGGLDSLCGLRLFQRLDRRVTPVFAAHGSGDTGLVSHLANGCLKSELEELSIVHVQRRGGLQQTRGFLFAAIGGLVAESLGSRTLVISESGPTMFVPPICPLDTVTLTTSPIVLALTRAFLRSCRGLDLRIITPFARLTKAESVAWIRKDSAVPRTGSCVRPMFSNYAVRHCGHCFGCLIRRVACLVAGALPTPQLYDPPFRIDSTRNAQRLVPGTQLSEDTIADTMAVLGFCRDILLEKLAGQAKRQIEMYGVADMYRRFALDFLTALQIGYQEERFGTNPIVRDFYSACVSDGLISQEIARERRAEVAELKFRPDADFSILKG